MRKKILLLSALTLALGLSGTAVAQRANNMEVPSSVTIQLGNSAPIEFYSTTVQELSRTFIKLTGVDLSDDKLIDDFAAINNCDMYVKYYRDEFNWRQVREAFRRIIQRDLEQYPEHFYFTGITELGRYDFEKKAFILSDEHRMRRMGLMTATQNVECAGHSIDRVPLEYNFRLTNPISVDSIPMEENKARRLISMMEQSGNPQRQIYVSIFVRANDFSTMGSSTATTRSTRASVRATMLSTRFYLDADRKIMIYEYTGANKQ